MTNDPHQGDWFGASVYDYIHPEDQEKARTKFHHHRPHNHNSNQGSSYSTIWDRHIIVIMMMSKY